MDRRPKGEPEKKRRGHPSDPLHFDLFGHSVAQIDGQTASSDDRAEFVRRNVNSSDFLKSVLI